MYYVVATFFGTFIGMLLLIVGLQSITKMGLINENFISSNVWLIFLGLTLLQVFQLIKKKKIS
jgi:hypothetical protein